MSVANFPLALKPNRERKVSPGRSGGMAMVWAVIAGIEVCTADSLPLYDFGNPNGAEQYYIELVNRARANPAAEAQRFRDAIDLTKRMPWEIDWDLRDITRAYGVDMEVMVAELSAIPAAPPLAPNAKLMSVARSHTQWMFANRIEEHSEIPGVEAEDDLLRRVSAAGYHAGALGENIYAYAHSLFYSHAGFEIDWGGPHYGMQDPPAHRQNNHSELFRELGVGASFGFNGTGETQVGPVVGTVDFGVTFNSPAFVTGVAFYDLNGNGDCDPEEGIRGLRVEVSGATHAAETADGGGFVIPVPTSDATRMVTISGLNASMEVPVTISAGESVYVRFMPGLVLPEFAPPVLRPGVPTTVSFLRTIGATRYQLLRARKVPAAAVSCDSANGVSFYVTPNALGAPSYPIVQTQVVAPGSTGAFHLAHPEYENQWIMLNPTFLCRSDSSLSFQSRLRVADPRQVARVQASLDDGITWTDFVVPNQLPQVGSGTTGQTAFVTKTVPLGTFAGRLIRLRFAYTMGGLGINKETTPNAGWFIDSISFLNTSEIREVAHTISSDDPWIRINPAAPGPFVIAVRPEISGRFRAYGPAVESMPGILSQFHVWAIAAELALALEPGKISGNPTGIAGDGLPHLLRYALGLNSEAASGPLLPRTTIQGLEFVLEYTRDVTRSDVDLVVEVSVDLSSWFTPGHEGSPVDLVDVVERVNGNIEYRRASVRRSARPVYLRVRAATEP